MSSTGAAPLFVIEKVMHCSNGLCDITGRLVSTSGSDSSTPAAAPVGDTAAASNQISRGTQIALIVVGSFLAAWVAVALVFVLVRRRKQQQRGAVQVAAAEQSDVRTITQHKMHRVAAMMKRLRPTNLGGKHSKGAARDYHGWNSNEHHDDPQLIAASTDTGHPEAVLLQERFVKNPVADTSSYASTR
jgi:hypothetical protein